MKWEKKKKRYKSRGIWTNLPLVQIFKELEIQELILYYKELEFYVDF